jgi:hypothetical protein
VNEQQVKVLLDGIIQLSQTIEVLNKPSTPTETELVAFDKVKRVFLSLMEMPLHNAEEIEIYEFSGEYFELVDINK